MRVQTCRHCIFCRKPLVNLTQHASCPDGHGKLVRKNYPSEDRTANTVLNWAGRRMGVRKRASGCSDGVRLKLASKDSPGAILGSISGGYSFFVESPRGGFVQSEAT